MFFFPSNSNTQLWNERTTLKWIEWNTLFKVLLHLNIFTFRRHSWSKHSSYGTYWKKKVIHIYEIISHCDKIEKMWFCPETPEPLLVKNKSKQTKKQETFSICLFSFFSLLSPNDLFVKPHRRKGMCSQN